MSSKAIKKVTIHNNHAYEVVFIERTRVRKRPTLILWFRDMGKVKK